MNLTNCSHYFNVTNIHNSDFLTSLLMTKVSVKSHQITCIFLYVNCLQHIIRREKSRQAGKHHPPICRTRSENSSFDMANLFFIFCL